MAKRNRVEVRLDDRHHSHLVTLAKAWGVTMTGAVETLLRLGAPTGVFNVRPVGVRGRKRVSVRFESGMVVHGFLWSRGGQLLPPQIATPNGAVPIVQGSKDFWLVLRALFTEALGVEKRQRRHS